MNRPDPEIIKLRRELHRQAELAGNEIKTAAIIRQYLEEYPPDEIIEGLGGYGFAAVYRGKNPGPRIMIRCDLDALPIAETMPEEHQSLDKNVSHKCGHDGHMAIVTGLAPIFSKQRPEPGEVALLYQPAEEIGKGALRVLEDSKFKAIEPDFVFALHNLPGFPERDIILREDVFASASRGLIVKLKGQTSHAAEPEKGRSPAMATAQLIETLSAMTQFYTGMNEPAKVTVIHARLGEIAFGTSPGEAEVMATLRTHSAKTMDSLSEKCESAAKTIAGIWGLEVSVESDEVFPATVNDNDMVKIISDSARELNLNVHTRPFPFPWSEDFGNFTERYKGALFGLGAGTDHPALHHPDYDFPDSIIEAGTQIFETIIRRLLIKK